MGAFHRRGQELADIQWQKFLSRQNDFVSVAPRMSERWQNAAGDHQSDTNDAGGWLTVLMCMIWDALTADWVNPCMTIKV